MQEKEDTLLPRTNTNKTVIGVSEIGSYSLTEIPSSTFIFFIIVIGIYFKGKNLSGYTVFSLKK